MRSPDHIPSEATSDGKWRFYGETSPEPTAWLIKGLLPETGAALLSGQWGTYKTTVALDISVSIMAGLKFANRFRVKRTGGVVYLAPEGSSGLESRVSAIAHARGLTKPLPFAWRADCPPLISFDAVDKLTKMVASAAAGLRRRFNVPVVLIFVDTIVAAAQ